MKCKVCGAESGKYPLCRVCNIKKEKGEIIKCQKCNDWHYATQACRSLTSTVNNQEYLYEVKRRLISKSENDFYNAIKNSVPNGYCVFPQINLASFIDRTDNAKFHNELFRNVDFLITNAEYAPKIIIEINDQTHLNAERKERDEKVQNICEEAGIPIIKLWTSYGVNEKYIKEKIDETLNSLPIKRIKHEHKSQTPTSPITTTSTTSLSTATKTTSTSTPYYKSQNTYKGYYSRRRKKGCYIASCVYGSYDCPNVWVLRRYRDNVLAKSWYGKIFIGIYYLISPSLVKCFGESKWFKNICLRPLNRIVISLKKKGFEDTPYAD